MPTTPSSLSAIASVSTITLFAMLGIECATIPAARVRDPERNIPRATLAGTLIAAAIYIGISAVPMFLIPQHELAQSTAPFADLLNRLLGGRWGGVIALFVAVSGLGALNGWTLVIGEVTETMARHGGFPRWLSRENAHGAPTRALVITGVIASLILLLTYAGSVAALFETLTTVAVYLSLPLYIGAGLAIALLPRSAGRSRILLAAALLAVFYCLWLFYGVKAKELLWGVGLGIAGVPVYLACTRAYAVPASETPR